MQKLLAWHAVMFSSTFLILKMSTRGRILTQLGVVRWNVGPSHEFSDRNVQKLTM